MYGQPSKKMEIKEKAKTYAKRLFPSILWVIESNYDFHYARVYKLSNPNEVFPNVKLDILFENFTQLQKTFYLKF